MGVLDLLIADKLRKNRFALLGSEFNSLLGQEGGRRDVPGLTQEEAFSSRDLLDPEEADIPLFSRPDETLREVQPTQPATGFQATDRGGLAQSNLKGSLLQAGASPAEANQLLSGVVQEGTKPTTLQRNFSAALLDDPNAINPKTNKPFKLFDFLGSGQTINVGTNIKPPSGFRFINPDDPQNSPVEPIPGSAATRGTADQQKKIAAFEGIRGMVTAMQEGLKDGINPNSLSVSMTGMLKSVPVLAGLWEGFNGDAKKESKFLQETENFGITALQIMRGAQVGPAEQKLFKKSLPTEGMTRKQYENALNTSIRIFNDSMRATIGQLGANKEFSPIPQSSLLGGGKESREQRLNKLLGN
jgi:hypothetical protein